MAAINYAALYQELGLQFVKKTGDNWTGHCPFHDDRNASFSIEVHKGVYKCFVPSCSAFKGGSFKQFYKLKTGKDYEEQFKVPDEVVKECHHRLLKDKALLKWIHEFRGWSDETIKKFQLGYDGERVTIPIYQNGECVNLRRYSPKKGAAVKMLSYQPGYGSSKLFPEENLKGEIIVLCEGEPDAILLCQLGYFAMTTTSGAGNWKSSWNKLFDGKIIYVLYDIDQAGREGANLVCKHLKKHAKTVKDIVLPITSPSNADVTDYIVTFGHGKSDLDQLFDEAPVWEERVKQPTIKDPAVEVELSEASQAKWIGKQIKVKATIAGKDLSPYACPKKVKFTCNMGLRICRFCSIGQAGGQLTYEVPNYGLELLKLINCTEETQRQFLRKAAGVYPSCPRFELETETYHTIEDIRLIPEVSFNNLATAEYVVRQAFHVGHGLIANNVYEFEGSVVPNPKNQYVTFVLPKSKPIKDSVAGFTVTDKLIDELQIFQSGNVHDQFQKIAEDLTYNVTHIYQREDLIKLIDLIYHSVLQFEFQGRIVKKGWTEGLILGDTRCGKTETVTSLIEHYKAGELSTGENASFAGLIGGMQQVGSRWSIIWGKFPLNDRRLLVIDEVSGMPIEDIGKMSGVRSSGIAEIIKVQQEKTFARTRLIWLGNPRSSRSLATYDTGVQALKELIGRPEDIARFDIAMTVASGEVSIDVINQQVQKKVDHIFTSDLCHKLILWTWSRGPQNIKFTDKATKTCLSLSSDLSKKYSAVIPLIEPAEQRIKLARLSTAAAARLFSTKNGEDLVVEAEHVEYAHQFLEKVFNSPSMNYGSFSKAQNADLKLRNEDAVYAVLQPYGKDLVEALLERQYLRMIDFEDVLNLSKGEVKPIIAKLVQNRALKHYHSSYVKTPAFIEFLRRTLVKGFDEPTKIEEEY